MHLRCGNKLHAVVDGRWLEVTCDSRWCGKRRGNVVMHRFDLFNGKLVSTRLFSQLPPTERSGDAASGKLPAIRTS